MAEPLVTCDLIIEAGWVVPVQPHGVVLENYAVVVSGDVIIDLLPASDSAKKIFRQENRFPPRGSVAAGPGECTYAQPDDTDARRSR